MTLPRWLRHHWREVFLGLVWLAPILSLLLFGLFWLGEKQALVPWFVGAGLLVLAAWPVRRSLRRLLKRRAIEFVTREAQPLPDWGPRELEAQEKVNSVAVAAKPLSFIDAGAARDLALQTVRVVAKHYRPDVRQPELEIAVPDALLLAERLAQDLRKLILKLPLSRSVTLGTLFHVANSAGKHGPVAKSLYKYADLAWNAVLIFINPPAGAARVAKGHFAGQAGSALLGSAQAKATRLFVLKVGRDAIDLFSGRLSHSEQELAEASERDIKQARHARLAPPRLLLVGQVNVGKSSLVNALAGQVLCDVQTVPTPAGPKEHVLSMDGDECAVLMDMPGLTNDTASRHALAVAVERCDMIVWVISAVQPGRDTDIRAWADLRGRFEAASHRRPPPWVIAPTYVDRLSPAQEWLPPYNVVEPSRPKEKTMQAAMGHVAATFGAALDAVVPVALRPGVEPWNIEFLWARIGRDLDLAKFRQLERLRMKNNGWHNVFRRSE